MLTWRLHKILRKLLGKLSQIKLISFRDTRTPREVILFAEYGIVF